MIGVRRNPVKAKPGRKVTLIAMLELPDFSPLRVTRSRRALSRGALDSLDHLLIVGTKRTSARTLQRIPQGRQLATLLARALERGEDFASTRATNARAKPAGGHENRRVCRVPCPPTVSGHENRRMCRCPCPRARGECAQRGEPDLDPARPQAVGHSP